MPNGGALIAVPRKEFTCRNLCLSTKIMRLWNHQCSFKPFTFIILLFLRLCILKCSMDGEHSEISTTENKGHVLMDLGHYTRYKKLGVTNNHILSSYSYGQFD